MCTRLLSRLYLLRNWRVACASERLGGDDAPGSAVPARDASAYRLTDCVFASVDTRERVSSVGWRRRAATGSACPPVASPLRVACDCIAALPLVRTRCGSACASARRPRRRCRASPARRRMHWLSAMILTQVHLRKPCYDFYFLEVIKFVSLSTRDAATSAECRGRSVSLTKPLNR